MKSPLRKRIPKELRQDIGKYIVIFVFMLATIGLVSGFLVADSSMKKAYDDSFDKYNIEDGNFELLESITDDCRKQVEKLDIELYNNNYLESTILKDRTLRIFSNREEINQVCVLEGKLPKEKYEIAIDRLYAENNKLHIDDTITISNQDYTITGTVALSDYSALFSNNSDMMFDATKFGVGVVTEDSFKEIDQTHRHFVYSWKYNDSSLTEKEKRKREAHLQKKYRVPFRLCAYGFLRDYGTEREQTICCGASTGASLLFLHLC